jgi:endoglucanase
VLQVPLLDDLEDGNHQTLIAEGRGGYWYTYADETSTVQPSGTFAPTAGGAEGSAFAARMHGQIGSKQYPYAGLGLNLTEPMNPYDLSSCAGISLRAKKGSPEAVSLVRLKVGDVNTVPAGNVCKECYNDFGVDLTLTTEWVLYESKFADMQQEAYWGEPRPALDVTRVFQVQFLVKDSSAPFDVWVDDLRLIGCKGTSPSPN